MPPVMKIYKGRRTPSGGTVIMVNDRLLQHQRYHSPTGMEWGYPGSGPADLALSILADYFGEDLVPSDMFGTDAWLLHQKFKFDHVTKWDPKRFHITADEIRSWVATQHSPRFTAHSM